jgi:RNA polymerase sigma factor (sigma-70 family)
MDAPGPTNLLRDYAENSDEKAFARLVDDYIDLVFSTALRRLNGDRYRAQDVTQTVFVDLARSAKTMPSGTIIAGWLYRHTCFTAAKFLRSEHRRQLREQVASNMNLLNRDEETVWTQLAPLLDEALNSLRERDRNALVLRFLEHRSLRDVGLALGASEDAARVRIDRALEKLRSYLSRRGVAFPGATLATVIAANAVSAAPAGLASAVFGAAIAAPVAGVGGTLTILKIMAMTKVQTAVSGVLITGLAAGVILERLTITRLEQ